MQTAKPPLCQPFHSHWVYRGGLQPLAEPGVSTLRLRQNRYLLAPPPVSVVQVLELRTRLPSSQASKPRHLKLVPHWRARDLWGWKKLEVAKTSGAVRAVENGRG